MSQSEQRPNAYDPTDTVRRIELMQASHARTGQQMKLAAYRVRDPETQEFGSIQFHMTYDNTVMAVMGESAAKLFTHFVNQTLEHQNGIRTRGQEQPVAREPAAADAVPSGAEV